MPERVSWLCILPKLDGGPRAIPLPKLETFLTSPKYISLATAGLNRYATFMKPILGIFLSIVVLSQLTQAAFLIEVDTDGADDGNFAFSPNFAFGGDTTSASQSNASTAVGITGGDSIFGGNGTTNDTYTFVYSPTTDIDNLSLAAGTALNAAGDTATGLMGGAIGVYNIYATWPFTSNVSGGLTSFDLPHDSGTLSVQVDQNGIGSAGTGHEWIFLGTADLSPGTSYTLTQTSGAATFVSMRSSGVLFERIPEPSTALLLVVALATAGLRRRRA